MGDLCVAADSGQVDLNSFDDTNESLSLSDSHSTTEEFNLTRHPRLQILSLSLEQKNFILLFAIEIYVESSVLV